VREPLDAGGESRWVRGAAGWKLAVCKWGGSASRQPAVRDGGGGRLGGGRRAAPEQQHAACPRHRSMIQIRIWRAADRSRIAPPSSTKPDASRQTATDYPDRQPTTLAQVPCSPSCHPWSPKLMTAVEAARPSASRRSRMRPEGSGGGSGKARGGTTLTECAADYMCVRDCIVSPSPSTRLPML
jgi:hypothetical protein